MMADSWRQRPRTGAGRIGLMREPHPFARASSRAQGRPCEARRERVRGQSLGALSRP